MNNLNSNHFSIKNAKVTPDIAANEKKALDLDTRRRSSLSTTRLSAWDRAQKQFEQEQKNKKNSTLEEFNQSGASGAKQRCFDNIRAVFKTKHFKDGKIEELYQRYFFQLHQRNLVMLVALLGLLALVLLLFHYIGGSTSPIRGALLGALVLAVTAVEIIANRTHLRSHHLRILAYVVFAFEVLLVLVSVCGRQNNSSLITRKIQPK